MAYEWVSSMWWLEELNGDVKSPVGARLYKAQGAYKLHISIMIMSCALSSYKCLCRIEMAFLNLWLYLDIFVFILKT